MRNFWVWLSDNWGWMPESTILHTRTIIENSHDAPDVGGNMRGEVISAAMQQLGALPEYPIRRVRTGAYAFLDNQDE